METSQRGARRRRRNPSSSHAQSFGWWSRLLILHCTVEHPEAAKHCRASWNLQLRWQCFTEHISNLGRITKWSWAAITLETSQKFCSKTETCQLSRVANFEVWPHIRNFPMVELRGPQQHANRLWNAKTVIYVPTWLEQLALDVSPKCSIHQPSKSEYL